MKYFFKWITIVKSCRKSREFWTRVPIILCIFLDNLTSNNELTRPNTELNTSTIDFFEQNLLSWTTNHFNHLFCIACSCYLHEAKFMCCVFPLSVIVKWRFVFRYRQFDELVHSSRVADNFLSFIFNEISWWKSSKRPSASIKDDDELLRVRSLRNKSSYSKHENQGLGALSKGCSGGALERTKFSIKKVPINQTISVNACLNRTFNNILLLKRKLTEILHRI